MAQKKAPRRSAAITAPGLRAEARKVIYLHFHNRSGDISFNNSAASVETALAVLRLPLNYDLRTQEEVD